MPHVSAIIAVYNGAATVAQAIDSVLAQTFGDLDLIVVNDGSTDGTPGVLRNYGDRIRVVDQPNCGVAVARNAGVRASRSEYIAFLDSDDAWAPTKIALAVAALEEAPQCVLAFSNLTIVDTAGHRLSEAMVAARKRANRSIFGYIGLKALNDGDRVLAREAFRRALAADPLRLQNYLRLLRTFLPHELARSLTGRTRNEGWPRESDSDL